MVDQQGAGPGVTRPVTDKRLSPSLLLTWALVSGLLLHPGQLRAQQPDPLQQARTLAAGNHLAEAERNVSTYLNGHDNSGEAHFLLAYILLRENKPVASLAEYTHASRLQKPTAQQLKFVALDYVLANDYASADQWLTRAMSWEPNDSDGWYDLGRIKYNENRFEEALNCFRKSLALTARSVRVENNMGLAYEGLGRPEDAIAAYRTAMEWQSGVSRPSEQPLINLAIVLVNRNQMDQALPLLKQAEALAPTNVKVHVELGRLYGRENQLPEAQLELERAVALAPESAAYHFQLGQVYRKSGQPEKARTEFAAAAAMDGSHSSHE